MYSEEFETGRIEELRSRVNAALEAMINSHDHKTGGEVAELASSVLLAGGKRIRPILIQLAYELAGGDSIDEIMPLALAFELIHTATLVHDDINDNAKLRRGVPTLHEKAGLAKALIAGDWLFVQGFGLGGRYDSEIVELMSYCCAKIATSELKQLDHINDLATKPEDYYSIVGGKTAGPFSAGCKAAAIVANADEKLVTSMQNFGMELGLAFQLVDDILDLVGDERMGKARGADVLEGKMTLPLIHSLTLLHGAPRERLAEVISEFNDGLWDELIELLEDAGSFDYARILVQNHIERALSELDNFADCEAKQLILQITEMMTDRHS